MAEPESNLLNIQKISAKKVFFETSERPFQSSHPNEAYAAVGDPEFPKANVRKNWLDRLKDRFRPNPKMIEVSNAHGRNMTEATSSTKVVWGGKLPGDIYGARTYKGSRMDVAEGMAVDADSENYYGAHAWGLMDDGCISRIKQASEIMRENGLPTEAPREIKKIKEVWVKTADNEGNVMLKKIPIGKWEKQELKRIEKEAQEADEIAKPIRTKLVKESKTYLEQTSFIVLERDLQVDERLIDLANSARNNKLKETLSPVMRWLNVATQTRDRGLISETERPSKFDIDNEKDLERYLTQWLPSQMGTYLGRFQRLGLRHQFLHNQNWSAVGTIYDLDSVAGKNIFEKDPETTKDNYSLDFYDTIVLGIIPFINDDLLKSDQFKNKNCEELAVNACCLFIKNYINERWKDKPIDEVRKELEEGDTKKMREINPQILNKAWDRLLQDAQKNNN